MSIETIRILDRFFAYTDKIGLELLEGDKRYIHHLSLLAPEKRLREALMTYIGHWQEGMNLAIDENRKQGEGRRRANEGLRDTLKYKNITP